MWRSHAGKYPHIEHENQQLEEDLSRKIKALKSLTIDIGNEVREQNKFLKTMDDDFDSSGSLLKSTMDRLITMSKVGRNIYLLYLFISAMFVFFVFWKK